ncbi:protein DETOXIFICATION 16-like isoform X2 [Mangifera indica]|uniref:protein DETOXIFICATION 16-like isoform X2 n=1 Tax=Mangifera indica TaxID=29780 RepID=UPI001CFC32F4|nr:protein DETOXIFICATION 16-like isoform X2 [Mangifera indica]
MEKEDNDESVLESPLIDTGAILSKNLFCDKAEMMEELKKQMHLAGPLVVVCFLQYSLQMISVMFVGHLGELSLASASMATSFAGVTGHSFVLGMGSALETFCGQAYGAKQNHMLGVYMQRAMLVLTFASLPIAILWAFTEQIFTTLKQDPQFSLESGIYCRWLIPSILPLGLLQCQLRFLQAQNNVFPLMVSTGITSLLHLLTCWTLIFGFGFGSKGAALSSAISYWGNVFILAIYIKFSPKCKTTWTGFSREALENLRSFLGLGIPSALMVCLEFWSYEFLVLMSGFLSNPRLETSMMSISLNTSSVVFRIPFGLGCAISTRVSNELGAGRPQSAHLAVLIAIFFAVMENLLLSSIAVAARDIWGYMYTNELEVIRYLASIMLVLAISNFMDGMQAVFSGIARGCGRQKICVYVNLAAYYLVGLPAAISLTFFFHLGGKARKAKIRVLASTIPTDTAS